VKQGPALPHKCGGAKVARAGAGGYTLTTSRQISRDRPPCFVRCHNGRSMNFALISMTAEYPLVIVTHADH